jgi:hypothetical protein
VSALKALPAVLAFLLFMSGIYVILIGSSAPSWLYIALGLAAIAVSVGAFVTRKNRPIAGVVAMLAIVAIAAVLIRNP